MFMVVPAPPQGPGRLRFRGCSETPDVCCCVGSNGDAPVASHAAAADGAPALSASAPMARRVHESRTMTDPLFVAEALARDFEKSAARRDRRGGTPKAERDALRASGLLTLVIPAALG